MKNRLDVVSLSLIGLLILSIAGINGLGSQISLDVTLTGADGQNDIAVGPEGPLTFVFSQAVQPDLLMPQIKITPPISGAIVWDDPKKAEFIPDLPLQKGVRYIVSLEKGAIGKSGEKIKENLSWSFQLRSPLITYLNSGSSTGDIWTISPDGTSPPKQITHTNGSLFDYAPSPNGELIIYSIVNAKQGIDLWVANRTGQDNHILLDCGLDRCSTVTWDVHSDQIAFIRQSAGITADAPLGAPRPWLMNVKTGENQSLYSDPQVIGFAPIWSPDGQKVETFEGVKGGIQILDLKTKQNAFIPTQSGEVGAWSLDSKNIYFTDTVDDGSGAYKTHVYTADASTGEPQEIFTNPNLKANYFYDIPVPSPKGDWLAVDVQPQQAVPDDQIWLISPDGQKSLAITQEPNYVNYKYSWNSQGDALVFQRVLLGATAKNEIMLWQNNGQPAHVIAKNASLPFWLP